MILGENIGRVYSSGRDIKKVYSYGKLVWEREDIDYSILPLTIRAVDSEVSVKIYSIHENNPYFKYSVNGTDWKESNISDKTTINLKKNDIVSILSTATDDATTTNMRNVGHFEISGLSDVYGNVMSLYYDNDFIGKTTDIHYRDGFGYGLFQNCDIRNAKNLILPATTLKRYCYESMFSGCNSLITAPELPATTLASSCYAYMFKGCNSLITAPELPATTLKSYSDDAGCYESMFKGCASLINAPKTLPATTLTYSCYRSMFEGCNSLTTAPELPATTLATNCYRSMFEGCNSLTTAPKTLPATSLRDYCYAYMFKGCNSLTTAPELPATSLVDYCYNDMFYNCSSLNYIKCYGYLRANYVNGWLNGVSETGTFVCYEYAANNNKIFIPSTWTVEYLN